MPTAKHIVPSTSIAARNFARNVRLARDCSGGPSVASAVSGPPASSASSAGDSSLNPCLARRGAPWALLPFGAMAHPSPHGGRDLLGGLACVAPLWPVHSEVVFGPWFGRSGSFRISSLGDHTSYSRTISARLHGTSPTSKGTNFLTFAETRGHTRSHARHGAPPLNEMCHTTRSLHLHVTLVSPVHACSRAPNSQLRRLRFAICVAPIAIPNATAARLCARRAVAPKRERPDAAARLKAHLWRAAASSSKRWGPE